MGRRQEFVFSLLLWGLNYICLFGNDLPLQEIPKPKGLDQVPQTRRFDWLLDHMESEPECFEYLKLQYFTLPLLRRDLFPNLQPSPEDAIGILKERLRSEAMKSEINRDRNHLI